MVDFQLRLLNPRTLGNIDSVDAHGGMLTAMCVSQADNTVVATGGKMLLKHCIG